MNELKAFKMFFCQDGFIVWDFFLGGGGVGGAKFKVDELGN